MHAGAAKGKRLSPPKCKERRSVCAHGSMARMAGERLQTPTALLVRCGCVARATRAPGARSLGERAARLFGCYVAQSRKSAWGHVSLFWYAGATAPLKRMAPFQWATVRVHMTGRLHVSFGCALSIPVQQDAIQQLEDAIEHNLVLAAARVARVRRSNLQAVENHKRAVQMLLKRCSFCTQRRSHGGTALLRVRGPLRRRATIGGRDASQVRLAGGAGRVR